MLEICFGALIGGRRDDFFWRSENPFPLSSMLRYRFAAFGHEASPLSERCGDGLPPVRWLSSWSLCSANAVF